MSQKEKAKQKPQNIQQTKCQKEANHKLSIERAQIPTNLEQMLQGPNIYFQKSPKQFSASEGIGYFSFLLSTPHFLKF